MLRSDSSSTFENINELETSFVSTDSDAPIFDESSCVKMELIEEELKTLKLENSRQKMEIELMKRERFSMMNDLRTNDAALKMRLSGSWKIISSSNLEKYLQNRRSVTPSITDLDDVIFQMALKNFEFLWNQGMLHENIGSMKFNKKFFVLNQPVVNEKRAESGEMTWISGNAMKTVSIGSDGSESSEEHYVEDERLHVITRGFGVVCERVYERVVVTEDTENDDPEEQLTGYQSENE